MAGCKRLRKKKDALVYSDFALACGVGIALLMGGLSILLLQALVDILAQVDDALLEKLEAPKGGMMYVESEFIEETLLTIPGEPDIVPGGSACNTIVGIANLGGPTRFVGKLGKDEPGAFFEDDLKKNNIEAMIISSQTPTGRVLSCVTPDAQRTMLTFLGASAEMSLQR